MSSLAIQEFLPVDNERQRPLPVRRLRASAVERFYRPELDVLRFFAFLAVFLTHGLPGFVVTRHSGAAAWAAQIEISIKGIGRYGVCLFFVLSAYLITELLCREKLSTQTIHVNAFYSRRILRIWPLYFAFLFVGVLLGLTSPDYKLEAGRVAAFLLLAGNWYVARIGCSANPIAPLWSISVEEQFYLVWPWIAKLGGRRAVCSACMILLPVSYLCLYELSSSGGEAGHEVWFNSLVQFQFFALGALLALVLRGRALTLRLWGRVGIFIAGLMSWLIADSGFHIDDPGPRHSPASILVGYGFVGLGCLLFLASFLGLSSRWLPKSLVHLGKISYGLYVFHMLSLCVCWKVFWPPEAQISLPHTTAGAVLLGGRAVLILLVGMGMTVMLAELSYRFLERPFLRMKERFAFISSRAV